MVNFLSPKKGRLISGWSIFLPHLISMVMTNGEETKLLTVNRTGQPNSMPSLTATSATPPISLQGTRTTQLDVTTNKTKNTGKDSIKRATGFCPVGHFECSRDSSLCIPQSAICNGKKDCPFPDDSDERNCKNHHDKKFWDSMFQKRPGADAESNGTCKYKLSKSEKEKLREGRFLPGAQQTKLFNSSLPSNATTTTSPENRELLTEFSATETLGGGSSVGCHCSAEKLFCQNLHLPNLEMIPRDVVFLDLSGSRVDNLDFNVSPNIFQQLRSLILSGSYLQSVSDKNFWNLPNLRILHLSNNQLTIIPNGTFVNSTNLRKLNLGYNKLSVLQPGSFEGLPNLEELDLRYNRLTGTESRVFSSLKNLLVLQLSSNDIQVIRSEFFQGLDNLETLSLSKNKIMQIGEDSFSDLTHLYHLYLSWNRLEVLEERSFCNLTSLLNLNLNDNQITSIIPGAFLCLDSLQSLNLERNRFGELKEPSMIFNNLTELQHIYFDQFWMCWWAPNVRSCEPKGDGISSVENLLDNILLRICVWLMGLVGTGGNIFVIISRIVLREKNRVHSFYIKNLAFADLLMGVFLLSIAFHDVSFRGEFLARQHSWRHSLTCQFSGVLSTLSSEGSVLILTLITLDRYVSIVRPFSERKNAMIPAVAVIIVLWIISFGLSYIPMSGLFYGYFGSDFYTSNGLCLPLHIHNPYDKAWEYSFVLFVVLNSLAFSFICYAYYRMLRIIQSSSLTIRSTQQKQDGVLAKRFGLVVLTDFICWAPVIIAKTVAMSGVSIPSDLYAWLAVFVLPVNSSLNPILYTLTTKLFKQQMSHFTMGFRKRFGMGGVTDDSMTSSMFYRYRLSRTMNTSLNSSMMMSNRNSRVDRNQSQRQLGNRKTNASTKSIIGTGTNGQVHPADIPLAEVKATCP